MRLKKLKRSQCVVLSLVLKRQWYDLIESGAKKVEWRRADYWLNRAYKWFRTAHINDLVPVVEFRHGYAKDSRRMAFACGWLWDRQKKLFRYFSAAVISLGFLAGFFAGLVSSCTAGAVGCCGSAAGTGTG